MDVTEDGLPAFLSHFTPVEQVIAVEKLPAWGVTLDFISMALADKFLYPDTEAEPEISW